MSGVLDPGSLTAIKLWLLAYVVAMAAGVSVWGDRWFTRADPFEAYSVVACRLSVFRRNRESRRIPVVRRLTWPTLSGECC